MKNIKRLLRKLFRVAAIGTVVQIKDDILEFGDEAGTMKVVTGYCKYYHRLGYRLDDKTDAIYLREDFKTV